MAVAKLREYENLQGAGVQEMINEVLLLSKFSHPCIVQVFGFLGKEPGFVLEYLTGARLECCLFIRVCLHDKRDDRVQLSKALYF